MLSSSPLNVGRRRFLIVMAGFAGLSVASANVAARERSALHRWQGTVIGAESLILLYDEDAHRAQRLIEACVTRIRRLEGIFSLHRPDSALARLNQTGGLKRPPCELLDVLEQSTRLSRLSGGAFDVTVQSLWKLYAKHFAVRENRGRGPDEREIARALRLVDYRAIDFDRDRIQFRRPGMTVTLNGIAQGYVTDRVADLLHSAGVENVLVDLGETRALGRHPDGRPWRVGIIDPAVPTRSFETQELSNQAVATSAGFGTRFDPAGRHHHLFDPRTGRSARRCKSVSVIASRAAVADGLSTALSIVPPAQRGLLLHAHGSAQAIVVRNDGVVERLGFDS